MLASLFVLFYRDGYNTKKLELKYFLPSLAVVLLILIAVLFIIGHTVYIAGPTEYLDGVSQKIFFHLPNKLSALCTFFLRNSSIFRCFDTSSVFLQKSPFLIVCYPYSYLHKYFCLKYSACSGVINPSLISAILMLP